MKRALVLAGGVAGIAWELGVPRGLQDADPFSRLDEETEALAPAAVLAVYADAASAAAFGTNPLSPATRGPSARAGREVGRSRAAEVAAFWAP